MFSGGTKMEHWREIGKFWDHPFNTYAKFSEQLMFLTPLIT